MSGLSVFKQPKPFYLIFLIEIWERYGFYGVQALIVLFMVKHLGYTDKAADSMFAAFIALVFLLPAVGGYIGDNILGTKRTILMGAVLLSIGYALLSLHSLSHHIALPLAIIAVGNGFFKANPSSLLSKVYESVEMNPDSGFTLYYMAINMGSFFSTAFSPVISSYYGWSAGFFASCIGLLLALGTFLCLKNWVKDYGSEPDHKPVVHSKLLGVVSLSFLLILASTFLLSHRKIMASLLGIGIIVFLLFYLYEMNRAKRTESRGMLLFIILFFQAVVFFVIYFQMPMSLTLYTLRNVDHHILGFPVEAASFQALNPIWIVAMSPVMAFIYQNLSSKQRDPSMATKFALGTLLAGLSMLVLPIGNLFASQGIANSGWLVLCYFLQATGELLVSALGLSMVTRYIPQRLTGFVMGFWFMSTSIASIISGFIAGLANIPKEVTDPLISLPIYSHLFTEIGLITVGIAAVMFLCTPLLNRLDKSEHPVDPLKTENHLHAALPEEGVV